VTHVGNILGYSAGYLDLSRLSVLSWLGGDQFRRFAMIAILGLVLSVGITSSLITESYSEASTFSSTSASYVEKAGPSFAERLRTLVRDMRDALRRLPRPIRRVCLVQLFAFMGWFPFLFFATTYIGTFETPGHSRPERERRERRGTEGML
jgi:solute carrier family 45 protein 1/2/4